MEITSYLLGKKSGGGGGKVQTLAQLNEKAKEYVNYLLDIPKSYESTNQFPTTLYTPDESCKCYIIAYKSNNKFCVYWIKTNTGINIQSNSLRLWYLNITQAGISNLKDFNNAITIGSFTLTGYYSTDFDTLPQCLDAILSRTTTYTAISGYPKINSQKVIPLSNTFIYDNETGEFIIPQKVSVNETIQVIQ